MMSLPTTTGELSWQPLQECLCLLTHGLGSQVRGVMCTHLPLPHTYRHVTHTHTHTCKCTSMHTHTGRCVQMYIHEEMVFFLAASPQYYIHPWPWMSLFCGFIQQQHMALFPPFHLSTISPLHLTSVPVSPLSLLLCPSRWAGQPVCYYNSCNQTITIISMSLL